jgi:cyclopropane fatty-acyl-phospholipid synthase-like methyltransferase
MDRDRISAITHGDRAFHNPLDPARVQEALDRLGLAAGDRVLDVGCGAGELLVGLAERHGCGGLGVDTSEILIAEARRRAEARAPGAELEFRAAPAESVEPDGSFRRWAGSREPSRRAARS